MFYEARQTYIEAIAMVEPEDRRMALLNAAHSANKAIASLQQTVRQLCSHQKEQSLLAIPEKTADKKYSGCTLAEIMHSCAELDGSTST